MIPKVDDYIKVNSKSEWIEIQKYLFNIGYKWCDNTQRIILNDNYRYPDYILIEIIQHPTIKIMAKNVKDNLMFSYGHTPPENSTIINATNLLRKYKLEKLNK